MEDLRKRFRKLLDETLIPDFCSNSARKMDLLGFRDANLAHLSEIDITDFLRGWEAQLLEPVGKGLYRTPQSGACEQFFWSGLKANSPRTFTLWIEPIIALGVLARMHLDLKWPRGLIGTQTKSNWAFDVFGYKSESDRNLLVACEVKKSCKEINGLINNMQSFGSQRPLAEEHLKSNEKNALKKVEALRKLKPDIFWAVGPSRCEKIFRVRYSKSDAIGFEPIPLEALIYDGGYSLQ